MMFYPFIKTGYELRGNSLKNDSWLHSTNTLEKFKIFKQQYDNFEINVILNDTGKLEVLSEDQTKVGIILDNFIAEMLNNDTQLWIDLKNINKNNKMVVCEKLESICCTYNIEKSRFVIETKDWESLSYLTNNNFYTSFFLDINTKDFNDEEAVIYASHLKEITDKGYVKAISFSENNYSFVKDLNITNVDLLRWDEKIKTDKLPVYYRSCSLENDEKVKVILMSDKCEI